MGNAKLPQSSLIRPDEDSASVGVKCLEKKLEEWETASQQWIKSGLEAVQLIQFYRTALETVQQENEYLRRIIIGQNPDYMADFTADETKLH